MRCSCNLRRDMIYMVADNLRLLLVAVDHSIRVLVLVISGAIGRDGHVRHGRDGGGRRVRQAVCAGNGRGDGRRVARSQLRHKHLCSGEEFTAVVLVLADHICRCLALYAREPFQHVLETLCSKMTFTGTDT